MSVAICVAGIHLTGAERSDGDLGANLLRLETLSGRREYREIAEDTLGCFAGIVEHFGLYAGSYGLALAFFLDRIPCR